MSFSKQIKLNSNIGKISIENMNGEIKVESWGGDQIRLEWEKQALNRDILDKIEVNIKEYTDKIEVKTYLPWPSSSFVLIGNSSRVDYKLFLPERRMGELSLETGNGGIEIEKLKQITRIEATTGNGKIEVSLLSIGIVNLETMNGAIHLRIPEYQNFKIEAVTTSGKIEFEPEMPVVVDEVSRNKFIAHEGTSQYILKLKTMNGNIEIS
jgi:hypothetical protein